MLEGIARAAYDLRCQMPDPIAGTSSNRTPMHAIQDPAVAAKFASYPPAARRRLMALRRWILETAAASPGVGTIEETLKWGEPAYLTTASGSGSTIRIDWKKKQPDQYAMYFNCNTTLVDSFRTLFAGTFAFEGNRALVFALNETPPRDAVVFCIAAALTYHRAPARQAAQRAD